MTGAGTAEVPYVIENWDDFAAINNLSKYYKLGVDLDANDRNGGVWSPLELKFAGLNGDGKKISNILHTDTAAAYTISLYTPANAIISDITIDNCVSKAGCMFKISNQNVIISRATLAVEAKFFANTTYTNWHEYGLYIADSAVSLKCWSTNTHASKYLHFTRSHIYLQVSNTVSSAHSWGAELIDSRLVGTVESATTSISFGAKNSVVALDTSGAANLASIVISCTDAAKTVVDSTLAAGVAITGTGVIPLSTADMQSAAALNAAGFTVVGE